MTGVEQSKRLAGPAIQQLKLQMGALRKLDLVRANGTSEAHEG